MNELNGARVLITGGAGFIGSHIADQLLAGEGVREVVLLDNMLRGARRNVERALASGRAQLVEGDIRDRPLLDRLFPGTDFCFHMAALRPPKVMNSTGTSRVSKRQRRQKVSRRPRAAFFK